MNRHKHTLVASLVALCIVSISISACNSQSSSSTIKQGYGSSASYVGDVLGIVIDSQGNVLQVEPSSAADKAGVTKGDRFVVLGNIQFANNGSSITDVDLRGTTAIAQMDRQAFETVKSFISSKAQPVPMLVERKGQILRLDVTPSQRIGRPEQPTVTPVPLSEFYL